MLKPNREWTYARNRYLSGEVMSSRVDAAALGLTPLRLEPQGTWDPNGRPAFEMEQVLPGTNPDDAIDEPIGRAVDLLEAGEWAAARALAMETCLADLRCLDAHAHLGLMVFDSLPQEAIRNYEVGYRIGLLSLPQGFDGVLPWGHIDNRPFLRCMYGYGLCLWRLGRFAEAAEVFERMLRLNPKDNQGVRFLIDDVQANVPWTPQQDE